MKKLLASLGILTLLTMGAALPAGAVDVFPNCDQNPGTTVCQATNDRLFGPNSLWTRILDTFTFIIGGISVLMIIVGGIRYITSSGDQAGIKGAKDTILYSVIGLIISIMAYSIVHFVISNF